MTSHIDDISHAQFCLRCHRWGPQEANFCGHCGLQLRSLPVASLDAEADARAHRRRRNRRLAAQLYGGTGLLGVLIGERIRDAHRENR